ncbi:MAG: insulinase family protein, partial [Bacteroidales bacterium]|nr:insulinase family protein [Bacteroidales bacterium]
EINSYKDNPAELIFDEFENQIFAGHPLGTFILGTPKSVRKFHRENILSFIQRTYHTDQMVIAVVGNLPFKKCVREIQQYFELVPERLRQFQRQPFQNYQVQHIQKRIRTNQAHLIIGCPLPRYEERKHLTASLLNNLLGGPGLNTRLNMAIREKKGYVYSIESAYAALSDASLFTVYAGMDEKNFEKCNELILKEFKKLREQKLGTLQLQRAKLQLIGQTCISNESNVTEMLSIGKNHLIYKEVETIPELLEKVGTITAEEVLEMANEMLREERLSRLAYLKK